MSKKSGIAKAISKAGSAAKLGALLEPACTSQAVAKWKKEGGCPNDRAIEINALYPELPLIDLLHPALAKPLRQQQ